MHIHQFVSYAVLVYGILVIVGGVIGYLQAKSSASLIAGGISGLLLSVCGVLMVMGIMPAVYGALLITFALFILFFKRYSDKKKFMPAGMMAVMSGIMLVLLITRVVLLYYFGPNS